MTPRQVHWRPGRFDWRDQLCIVWVSIAALDASWQGDNGLYLPPMPGASGRYARFGHWLQSNNPRRRVNMPIVDWCIDHVSFQDGRHRTAWLRDHGATAMPVLAHYESAGSIAALCGTSGRRTVVTMPNNRSLAA